MRNEFIFHTPCSAKQSYFSEYLLCNCSTGKARLELTPCELSAQLSLVWCLLLIGASSCSGSTLLWLFIFFVLSQSKHWQKPWAISSSSTTWAVLEQLPGTGNRLFVSPKCIHVKVLYQGSDSKEENRTSVFRVWSAIKRFLLSWTFGLNPWSCLSPATFLHFKHKLHLGLSVFPLFVVTLDDCKLGEHRMKYVNTQHC